MKNNIKNKKQDRFIYLAEKRMNKLITDMKLIGNLANRSNYVYTADQANKIISRINSEFSNIKNKFKNNDNFENDVFKF
tara:strand:- start:21 stop:257 length:237 start_codon:yes stop_codon:yes gene_type:complete